jgi:hypothetical protein
VLIRPLAIDVLHMAFHMPFHVKLHRTFFVRARGHVV